MDTSDILQTHKQLLFKVTKAFSNDRDEQKDLLQEIMIEIFKSIKAFRNESNIKTYLYRIALNTCIRYSQKYHLNQQKVSIEAFEWDNIPDKNNESEKIEMLYTCISQLNEADKSLVLLYLDDMNYKEIKEVTGLTENHIAVKMSRIREKLFICLTSKKL